METYRVADSFIASDQIMSGSGRIRIKKGVMNDKPKSLSCDMYSLATQNTVHALVTSVLPGGLNHDPRLTESKSTWTDSHMILRTLKDDKQWPKGLNHSLEGW